MSYGENEKTNPYLNFSLILTNLAYGFKDLEYRVKTVSVIDSLFALYSSSEMNMQYVLHKYSLFKSRFPRETRNIVLGHSSRLERATFQLLASSY